ncbi:MAG TPA: hypothetical protein VMU62_10760, partial [Acidobacteriaceae bacterium]|nr:hypothetical protein [Acidobacteriaceae bacterium]
MSAVQTRAVNALSRTKHVRSGNAVAGFQLAARFKKAAALILSYALLCCATQPMLLAQEPQPPIVSTAPVVKAPKPTRQASPKQLEKARNLFTKGTEALKKEDAERALTLLGEAHQLVPENAQYLAGYEIAKQQQVAELLHAAEKQQISGTPDAALGTLHLAHMLDPNSPFVREHMQAISEQPSATVQRTPLPELASGIIPLDAKATALSFHFRANAHDLIHRVFDAYGITTLLDESVPDSSVRLDMDSVSFDAASKAVQLVTNTFVVPLDAHRVLVAKDTRENREKFERLLLETIYLPGLSEKQMTDATNLVKNVFGVKQVSI